MASKQVTDREKSARAVAKAAETHADKAATALGEALLPHLESGETLPDIGLLLRLVGRWIVADNAALIQADEAHATELADDAEPRRARDETAEEVRRILVDLRGAVEVIHGPATLVRLKLKGAVPTDPSVLARMGADVLKTLTDPEIKLPAPRRKGLKFDRKEFVDELQKALPPLKDALADVAREAREAETTLTNKRGAMDRNDRTFSRGASLVSATLYAGALDEIADRVRPSGRRPGQTAESDEEEPENQGSSESPPFLSASKRDSPWESRILNAWERDFPWAARLL